MRQHILSYGRIIVAIGPIALALAGSVTLSSCFGYGSLGTCRTPCADPAELRNAFCVCEKPTNIDGRTTLPPQAERRPEFHWEWEETTNCPLNRHYYIFNSDTKPRQVRVSARVDSFNRQTTTYSVAALALNKAKGTDIGFEELDGQNCFDQDFMLVSYYSSSAEELKQAESAVVQEVKQQAAIAREVTLQSLGALDDSVIFADENRPPLIETTEVSLLNCPAECNEDPNGTPSINCLKNTPPEADRLRAVRDRLTAIPQSGTVKAADMYNIFGITKDDCEREDLTVIEGRAFSRGKYCAHPMGFDATDQEPDAVLHFAPTISAKTDQHEGKSVLDFRDPTSMPVLVLRKKELQTDWGGKVLRIMATPSGVFYQTTGGCISMQLK